MKKILILCIIIFLVHVVYFLIDGLWDNTESAELAVVFGNTVHKDGTVSNRLKARLNRAIQLFKNNKVLYILVSGGLGKEGHNEAFVMKKYLIRNSIPEEKILVDPEGFNSWQTVIHCKRIMEKRNFKTVYAISQYFHISRVKMAFNKLGLSVYSASPFYFEIRDLFSILREIPAYYQYLFFKN